MNVVKVTEGIWKEYADQLRGFIHKRIPDTSLTDDLLQEVFVKVQSRISTLRDESRLQSWLYQITRNTVIDYFRKQKPEAELPETLDLPETGQFRVLEELAECVRPMMDILPEKYRLPLLLSELEGIPQKEVADLLGLSLSAAKSRVQRGREQLKDVFIKCCHFKLDHLGGVIDYQPRDGKCARC